VATGSSSRRRFALRVRAWSAHGRRAERRRTAGEPWALRSEAERTRAAASGADATAPRNVHYGSPTVAGRGEHVDPHGEAGHTEGHTEAMSKAMPRLTRRAPRAGSHRVSSRAGRRGQAGAEGRAEAGAEARAEAGTKPAGKPPHR